MSTTAARPEDRFDGGGVSVRLTTGANPNQAPVPEVAPLAGSALQQADAALRAQDPSTRAHTLARLGVALRQAERTSDAPGASAARSAIDRVWRQTDRVTMEQTLRSAVQSGTVGFLAETRGLESLISDGRRVGLNVNDVLAQSATVKERGLTTSEARAIETNFAGTLDPSTVRFKFTTGAQTMGASAMVIGNTIHVDPTSPQWGFTPGTTLPANPDHAAYQEVLLAHEPAHVWSYQHQGSRYALNSVTDQLGAISSGASRNAAYVYDTSRASFFDYGEEQRAMIVQDYVAAQRAVARGDAQVYAYGQQRWATPSQLQAELEPFVREMRAAGPGQAQPPGGAHPVACACPSHGFAQDGVAAAVAANADALVAGLGRASMDALRSGDTGQAVLGGVGVAAVVATSVLPREQNAHGAQGGGSALLDQAGVPRGVTASSGGFSASAHLAYAAGLANPRGEFAAGYRGQLGSADINARVEADIGLGGVQRAAGQVSVDTQGVDVDARIAAQFGIDASRYTGGVAVRGAGFSAAASAGLVHDASGIQSAQAEGRVDTDPVSFSVRGNFGRELAFDRADVGVAARLQGGSLSADLGITPSGVDTVRLAVAAQDANTQLSVHAYGEDLTTRPVIGGGLSVNTDGGQLNVSGERRLDDGHSAVRVGLLIPIKP